MTGSYAQGESVDSAEQRRILDQVEAAAREAGAGGLVVFDLDSTLYDNRPRVALILREFGRERGLAPLLEATPAHIRSWSLAEALRNAGLDEAEVQEQRRPLREFWARRFFTSEYCLHDVPIAGAVAYVTRLREVGAQIAYVTGRDVGMGEGTRACLARDRFPEPGGGAVHLLLKPSSGLGDDPWKETAHGLLRERGKVVAAFDNEPAHINGYARGFPEARCVRLATDDSGRPVELLPGIERIADFRREGR